MQERLRAYVEGVWTPLYEPAVEGEWAQADLRAAAASAEEEALGQEFLERVNEELAGLGPRCRRLLQCDDLDELRGAGDRGTGAEQPCGGVSLSGAVRGDAARG